MTKEVLSDTEARKLFNSIAANINDADKINELMSASDVAAEQPAATETEVPQDGAGSSSPPVSVTTEVSPAEVNREQPDTASTDTPADAGNQALVEELEALRAKYQALEHRYRSDDGRVSAFQRKVADLESKLAALAKASPEPPAPAPASKTVDPSEVEANLALEDLKRVDPALYKILVARDAAHKRELESLKLAVSTELAPVRQTVNTYERDREKLRLKELVPNIEEVVVSEEFNAYREAAPQIVKQWLSSKSADDVVEGMRAYALHLQMSGRVPVTQAPPAPAATPAKPAPSPVASERERKLATSVNVGPPPASPVRKELTPDELFSQLYSQLHESHRTR